MMDTINNIKPTRIHPFKTIINEIKFPSKFPYLYTHKPHPLCCIASEELQSYLQQQTLWNKLLGVNGETNTVGKMFGVLVVQQINGKLGYLAGFSGAIGTCNTHPHFVPPVFNLLNPNGFFKHGEQELNTINLQIKQLESSEKIVAIRQKVEHAINQLELAHKNWKKKINLGKQQRKKQREIANETLIGNELNEQINKLNKISQLEKINYKKQISELKQRIYFSEEQLHIALAPLAELKLQRKEKSAQLQNNIFKQFQLLNSKQELKNILEIFKEQGNDIPPAGTGDCAGPKLLQYAFKYKLKPIALAEFWWGAPPKSEIRKHKQFYPPCSNKCAPIMKHMLKYIEQETNPLDIKSPVELEIIFEDEYLIAINKPEQFLSVPGKNQTDSVLQRLKQLLPNSEEVLLVHRLDMATSGVLLAAKNTATYKALQSQFIKRTTQKCYIAILDGILEKNSGIIDLPLRVDLNNRPQQLVCYEYGKSACTHWEIIELKEGKTRVHFYPITGRTHQLRVHAAHVKGLNTAIVGDELYGKPADRLYLHAYWLKIVHPHTGKEITFYAPKAF